MHYHVTVFGGYKTDEQVTLKVEADRFAVSCKGDGLGRGSLLLVVDGPDGEERIVAEFPHTEWRYIVEAGAVV